MNTTVNTANRHSKERKVGLIGQSLPYQFIFHRAVTANVRTEGKMRFLRKRFWVAALIVSLGFFACVTINIYFPAEKVESVAGEIVDDIRDRKGGEEGASQERESSSLRESVLAFFCSHAMAEEITTISNPTIRELKNKMKNRYRQMKPYYGKEMLKEGDNGYVSLGETKGLGLKEKRDLKNLVDAENKNRKELYGEIAKALKIESDQVNKIAEIFAKEWQKPVR